MWKVVRYDICGLHFQLSEFRSVVQADARVLAEARKHSVPIRIRSYCMALRRWQSEP